MADDNAPTQLYEKAHWLKPVVTAAELPTADVPEGAQCFVSATGEIYRFAEGAWTLLPDEDD
jgi:hypothetical protein